MTRFYFQVIADRVEIEALRGEFTDAAMMRDRARLASPFTPDGALRMPNIPAELVGREEIRAGGERLQAQWVCDGRSFGLTSGSHWHRAADRATPIRHHLRPATRHITTSPGGTMTTPIPATLFTDPAPAQRLERAAAALTAHGFTAEILDDAAAARTRIKDLIPEGASVFTGASETLRLSGIDEDINNSGRYEAIRRRGLTMDRATQMDEIRRVLASPDVIVGSVAAVTETGSLVVASASGSQLTGYAGGSARVIWVIGAQKVVPDLSTALRRIEDHCLPLENDRAMKVYGQPSAINRVLILNAEPHPGRGTVLLLREAIGF